MKKWKSNLDEAQEQKLLKIEHNGCWLCYWGLIAVLVIQTLLDPTDMKSMAGEWIVFMALCLYMVAACLKNGIWDRHFKPTRKTSLVGALIAGCAVGTLFFIMSYRVSDDLVGSLISAALGFLFTGGLTYAAMAICLRLYQNRVKKLDSEIEE